MMLILIWQSLSILDKTKDVHSLMDAILIHHIGNIVIQLMITNVVWIIIIDRYVGKISSQKMNIVNTDIHIQMVIVEIHPIIMVVAQIYMEISMDKAQNVFLLKYY